MKVDNSEYQRKKDKRFCRYCKKVTAWYYDRGIQHGRCKKCDLPAGKIRLK